MRIVGVRQADGSVLVGALSDDGSEVAIISGLEAYWRAGGKLEVSGATVRVTRGALVPPVLGSARVLCVGLNYRDHVNEGAFKDEVLPEFPTLFARWPASLTTDGAEVPVPSDEDGLDWEGEVVAWVGSTLVDATPDEALAAVIGYSTFNDITSRRAQKRTSQWIIGKNGDRSGPLGPMVPAAEVGTLAEGLRLETRVNGEIVQNGSTAQMIFGVGETLAHISRTFTINPGDLLATGTPSGVGYARTPPWLLQPGDVVEVEVERLGTITNRIVGNSHRLQAGAGR
jgi:2-keto-4-pentenoate hydratase/2-oxohepta-3-ene-1,7-dioic acid hydratase in catechol pathway